MFKKRTLYLLLFLLAAFTGYTIYWCNNSIEQSAIGKLYSNIDSIPYNKTGLLLGTSKYLPGNYVNPYYDHRIQAAVKLIKAGKIKYLIISGDNATRYYNEPEMMRRDVERAGIDSAVIYLDYAGFRTYDSMIRLKEIFGQDSVTVISQQFHNERAIYISTREGIAAIGFNARDIDNNQSLGFRVQLREKLARVKVFLDYLFDKRPKYLGKKIYIP